MQRFVESGYLHIEEKAGTLPEKIDLWLRVVERAPVGRVNATEALVPGEENLIVAKVTDTFVNELGTFGINGPAMIYAEPAE